MHRLTQAAWATRPLRARHRWILPLAALLLAALATSLYAATFPRETLWRVEQACILNHRLTGSPFPCLDVDLTGGAERGYAILRAPLRHPHIVAMPTVAISGVEAPQLRGPGAPNYFKDAWDARHYVQDEVPRPLGWSDLGLAVNSKLTRSQDQLHIHIDCVRSNVKRALAARRSQMPTGAWQGSGFSHFGQTYWARRLDDPSLDGVDVFQLASQIPAVRDRPDLQVLALIGVSDPGGRNGFVLLVGLSDPDRDAAQATSEDLLDHSCRR